MCFTTALISIELREEECDLVEKKQSEQKDWEETWWQAKCNGSSVCIASLFLLAQRSCLGFSSNCKEFRQFVILRQPNISSKILLLLHILEIDGISNLTAVRLTRDNSTTDVPRALRNKALASPRVLNCRRRMYQAITSRRISIWGQDYSIHKLKINGIAKHHKVTHAIGEVWQELWYSRQPSWSNCRVWQDPSHLRHTCFYHHWCSLVDITP